MIKPLILNIQRLKEKNLIKNIKKIDCSTIYIDIMHLDYWWGIYELAKKTSWEDITIYTKKGNRFKKIGWVCICTKPYFENSIEELEKDIEERDFVKKIKRFLSSNEIKYHYYYDNPQNANFYEVPFEAARNQINVKPRSIEIWHPDSGIDKATVDGCVKDYLKKFLDINVKKVQYKYTVSMEEAIVEYAKEIKQRQECQGISFSDELVKALENKWQIPKEKVLEIIKRSVK